MIEILQSIDWTRIILEVVALIGTNVGTYMTATGQWTKKGRNKRRRQKENESFDKMMDKKKEDK